MYFNAIINCILDPYHLGSNRAVEGTCLGFTENCVSTDPGPIAGCTLDVCKTKSQGKVYLWPRNLG